MAAVAALALGCPAASAHAAGDPVMPLGEVQRGMQCTAYSVVQGTAIDSFAARVLDVVDDGSGGGPRILIEVSGPAIDRTGIGPGFSGSPIYCPDAAGARKVAGAIAETIGEYGGKVLLATPIEEILGESPDPPAEAGKLPPAMAAKRRPIATPLSVSGLSPALGRALTAAARKKGRTVLVAPASPKNRYPPQQLRPGSAFGVGYSTGDLSVGAIGTIAYVDGEKVWGFGHSFEGVGRRSLLLQDAYVYHVISNPLQTGEISSYKLAGSGHDIGTISNDALGAVAGRLGALPTTIPVRLTLKDADTGTVKQLLVQVADEADLGQPTGVSPLSFVAPLAVTQAATTLLRGSPTRLTGEMCLRVTLRERPKPLRFCNRYVGIGTGGEDGGGTSAVPAAQAQDVLDAVSLIDSFKFADLHVTDLAANITLQRGARQAFLRRVKLPRTVRPGQRVRGSLVVQRIRAGNQTIPFTIRVPSGLNPGLRTLTLTGTDADTGDALLGDLSSTLTIDLSEDEEETSGGDPGPRTLAELIDQFSELNRYDGVAARFGGRRIGRAFRAEDLRLSGRIQATVRVVGSRRR